MKYSVQIAVNLKFLASILFRLKIIMIQSRYKKGNKYYSVMFQFILKN